MIRVTQKPRFTSNNLTGYTEKMKANLFGTQVCEYIIELERAVKATNDNKITIADQNFQTDDYITAPFQFANFEVGDEVQVVEFKDTNPIPDKTLLVAGTYLVDAKVSDSTIRLSDTLGNPITMTPGEANEGTIRLNTEPQAVEVWGSIIPNDDPINFNSPLTSEELKYRLVVTGGGGIPGVFTELNPVKKLGAYIGKVEIKKETGTPSLDIYEYTIRHTITLNPFYLINQNAKLLDNIPPNYFVGNALKPVFKVRLYPKDPTEPRYDELELDTIEGYTGWFETSYGDQPNYELNSFNTDQPSDVIAYTGNTRVTIRIDKLTVSQGDKANIYFMLLPEISTDVDNNNPMAENYCFDQLDVDIPGGTGSGVNIGTDFQVFKNVFSTNDDPNFFEVVFDIEFGADVISKIDGYTNRRWVIGVNAFQSGLDLPAQGDESLVALTTGTIFVPPVPFCTLNHFFLAHNVNGLDSSFALPDVEMQNNDEIVSKSEIQLDTTAASNISLNKVRAAVIIVNNVTGEEQELDFSELDISANPQAGGVIIGEVNNPTGFNVLSTEIRHKYRLFRELTLDNSSSEKAYVMAYPFICRWENWQELVTTIADFYQQQAPFSGFNHEWFRLNEVTNWGLAVKIDVTADSDSGQIVNTFQFAFPQFNYIDNPDWTQEEIKVFDSGGNQVSEIPSNDTVRIEGHFKWAGVGNMPSVTEMWGQVFTIHTSLGSFKALYSSSSIYDRTQVSPLFHPTASGSAELEAVSSDVMKVESYVDASKLSKADYQLVGKIARKNPPTPPQFIECFHSQADRHANATDKAVAMGTQTWRVFELEVDGVDYLAQLSSQDYTVDYDNDFAYGSNQGAWQHPVSLNNHPGFNIAWALATIAHLNGTAILQTLFTGWALREATIQDSDNFGWGSSPLNARHWWLQRPDTVSDYKISIGVVSSAIEGWQWVHGNSRYFDTPNAAETDINNVTFY